MPATPDVKTLHAGMHEVEKAAQRLFEQAVAGGATLRFEWAGGQAGASIPVAEALTFVVSSPQGDGRRVLRQSDVEACARGVTPAMHALLSALTGEIAGGAG